MREEFTEYCVKSKEIPQHDDIFWRRLTTSFLSHTGTSGSLCKQTLCVCVAVWLTRATIQTKVLVPTHPSMLSKSLNFYIMYRQLRSRVSWFTLLPDIVTWRHVTSSPRQDQLIHLASTTKKRITPDHLVSAFYTNSRKEPSRMFIFIYYYFLLLLANCIEIS